MPPGGRLPDWRRSRTCSDRAWSCRADRIHEQHDPDERDHPRDALQLDQQAAAVEAADVDERDPADRGDRDRQQRDAERWRAEALRPPARRARHGERRVDREHDHQDHPRDGGADVAVHQLEDGARGRDRHHAAGRGLVDRRELDHHSFEDQQPGERDDERRHVEPRDQIPLEIADRRAHADAAEYPEPPGEVDR